MDVLRQQIRNYYGDPLGTGTFGADSNYAKEASSVAADGHLAASRHGHTGAQAQGDRAGRRRHHPHDVELRDRQQLGVQPGDQRDVRHRPALPRHAGHGRRWSTRRSAEGYAIFYLTGRPASQEAATLGNLTSRRVGVNAGYPAPTTLQRRRGRSLHQAGRRRLPGLPQDGLCRRPGRVLHDDPLQDRAAPTSSRSATTSWPTSATSSATSRAASRTAPSSCRTRTTSCRSRKQVWPSATRLEPVVGGRSLSRSRSPPGFDARTADANLGREWSRRHHHGGRADPLAIDADLHVAPVDEGSPVGDGNVDLAAGCREDLYGDRTDHRVIGTRVERLDRRSRRRRCGRGRCGRHRHHGRDRLRSLFRGAAVPVWDRVPAKPTHAIATIPASAISQRRPNRPTATGAPDSSSMRRALVVSAAADHLRCPSSRSAYGRQALLDPRPESRGGDDRRVARRRVDLDQPVGGAVDPGQDPDEPLAVRGPADAR